MKKKLQKALENFTQEYSLNKTQHVKKNHIKPIIFPKFIEKTFDKKFNEILITEEMIRHKFGEFLATRKRFSFKKTKK